MKGIGKKIKEIRNKKGLSQDELSELANVNLRTVQRLENSESEPRGKTLSLICEALEINVEDVLDHGRQIDKTYLVIFHLSVITFLVIPVGNIIIPLILWLNKKDKVIKLKEVGSNLLNFQIVWSILTFSCITSYAIFKIMHYENSEIFAYLFISLYILNIALPIYFAVQTKKGVTPKRYPNVLTLVK